MDQVLDWQRIIEWTIFAVGGSLVGLSAKFLQLWTTKRKTDRAFAREDGDLFRKRYQKLVDDQSSFWEVELKKRADLIEEERVRNKSIECRLRQVEQEKLELLAENLRLKGGVH